MRAGRRAHTSPRDRNAAGYQNGHHEGGWPVYDFFSETKTVYVDYSGTLQRAQIDTYDV